MLAAQAEVRKASLMNRPVLVLHNVTFCPRARLRSTVGAVLQQKPIQRVLELVLLLFARFLFGRLSRQLLFAPGSACFSVQQGRNGDGWL